MNVRELLWCEADPYAGTPAGEVDIQGWRQDQPLLYAETDKAALVAEVGVWKGYSSIIMAQRGAGHVVAIDHFRGSVEHFLNPKWRGDIEGLYDQFRRNVIAAGLRDKITPLPLDSSNAAQICHKLGIKFDVIHIDAAHDYPSVFADLNIWANFTRVLVVDDFHPHWPGVVKAVDAFLDANHETEFDWDKGKAVIRLK